MKRRRVAARLMFGTGLAVALAVGAYALLGRGPSIETVEVADQPSSSAPDTTPVPMFGIVDGPVLTSPGPSEPDPDVEQLDGGVGGALLFEAGCLYLQENPEAGDRYRYPVIWPVGTRWQSDPPAVVLPTGVVVDIGDVVFGGGGYHGESGVAQVTGETVAAAAAVCGALVGEGEIAVFNPGSLVGRRPAR